MNTEIDARIYLTLPVFHRFDIPEIVRLNHIEGLIEIVFVLQSYLSLMITRYFECLSWVILKAPETSIDLRQRYPSENLEALYHLPDVL